MKFSKIASIAAIVALSALGAAAQAAQPGKVTTEVGYSSVDLTGGGNTANLGVMRGMFGYELNDNLAVEGMVGFGSSFTDLQVGTGTINTKIDNMYGVYLKPKVQVTPDLEVFGRVGYAATTLSTAVPGRSATSDSGSYGVGVSYKLSSITYVSLDYMTYLETNGGTARGVTANVGFRF